jgi:hypothetical protein
MSGFPPIVVAQCDDALYLVGIGPTADEDELAAIQQGGKLTPRPRPLELVPSWTSAHFVDVDAAASFVVLALDRRPPLLVSHDRGLTWNERGAGLPSPRAVALGENPDHVLYAARNRLYVSADGGRFWRSLAAELPEIRDVAWG